MIKKIHNRQEDATWFTPVMRVLLMIGTVVMPLVAFPSLRDPFGLPKQLFLLGIVLLGVVCWLAECIILRRIKRTRTFLDAFLLVFVVAAIASAVLSVSIPLSFFGDPVNVVTHASGIVIFVLWLWLFVSYIETGRRLQHMLNAFLIGGSLSALLFLIRFIPHLPQAVLQPVSFVQFNTVSGVNSLFGLYSATIATLGFGIAALKASRRTDRIVGMVSGLLAIAVLFQLGFTLPWGLFAIGASILIVMGYAMPKEIRIGVLSWIFFLFLISIFVVVSGVPSVLKQSIPLEVALGASTSWDISSQTFLSSAKHFLVGSGPGTFVYDFSLYRPDSFNMSDVGKTLRFYQPFSTLFALLAEMGTVGTAAFVFLVLLAVGGMVGAWTTMYRRAKRATDTGTSELSVVHLDVFVLAAAWIALTIGFGFSFYDMIGWWSWWWLLAATLVGLAQIKPDFVEKKSISLRVASQHLLALSFGIVLLLTVAIGVVTYATRFFLAEVAFTKASRASTVEETTAPLAKAISYRSSYMPYRLALAKLSLQQARTESQKAVPNPDQVASHLSAAINEAKIVTQKDPFGVDGWNMLALLYMNAGSFTADAQGWAKSALQKALTLEPSNANTTLQLAIVEQSMNKMKEAETAYHDAINKQPDLVQAYTGLTDLYESQQRIDDAVALYEQMSGSIQNNPELLYQWGRVSYNRKKADDEARAEQLWLRAVELQPGFSNALYSLGLLYEKKGNTAAARDYYQKVAALNPDNADVKKKLNSL